MIKKRNKALELYFSLINLFLPRTCQACGTALYKHEKVICKSCIYKLPVTNFHLNRNNPVEQLFWGKIEIYSGAAFMLYQSGERVQKLIHKLKYKNKPEIGEYLGKLYAKHLKMSPVFNDVDFLIPVPLHPKKLRIRGYNQSEKICIGLSQSMGVKLLANTLIRNVHTGSQTKKNRFERWANVQNIFSIKSPELLINKNILLIDDVVTTGSTLEACVLALSEIEGIRISIATLAFSHN